MKRIVMNERELIENNSRIRKQERERILKIIDKSLTNPYRCPYCDKEMYWNIMLGESFDWWTCDNCKKTFELDFRELIKKEVEK